MRRYYELALLESSHSFQKCCKLHLPLRRKTVLGFIKEVEGAGADLFKKEIEGILAIFAFATMMFRTVDFPEPSEGNVKSSRYIVMMRPLHCMN